MIIIFVAQHTHDWLKSYLYYLYRNEITDMSMKKLSIVLLINLFLFPGYIFSQDENFLGLTLGAAFPQGTYAEKDYSNEIAGYANTGFLFTFDAAMFPDDYLGIGATVTYGSNNPDKEKYKQDLLGDVLNRYPDFGQSVDQANYDLSTWRYLNFHAGPCLTFPVGRLNIDMRVLAGLSLVWVPGQTLQFELDNGDSFSRTVQDKAAPTVGFTAGGGLRYALKSGYVFRFITEYTNCKPSLEINEEVKIDLEEGSEIITKKVDVPIKNIHVGIGIAYNFDL